MELATEHGGFIKRLGLMINHRSNSVYGLFVMYSALLVFCEFWKDVLLLGMEWTRVLKNVHGEPAGVP